MHACGSNESAHAAGRGAKRMRNSASFAAPGESVVREFLKRVERAGRSGGTIGSARRECVRVSKRLRQASYVCRLGSRTFTWWAIRDRRGHWWIRENPDAHTLFNGQ